MTPNKRKVPTDKPCIEVSKHLAEVKADKVMPLQLKDV
jgi:hypothetical protein